MTPVLQVKPVLQAQLATWAPPEIRGQQALLARPDPLEARAPSVLPARQDQRVKWVRLVILARPDPRVLRVIPAPQGRSEIPVLQETLGRQAPLVILGLLDLLATLDQRDSPEKPVPPDPRENLGPPVIRGRRALLVILVLLVLRVKRAPPGTLGLRGPPEKLDRRERPGPLARLAPRVLRDIPVQQAILGLPGPREKRDPSV